MRGVFSSSVIDRAGNAVPNTSVTVRHNSDQSEATIYDVPTGGTPINNPMTTDADGVFTFYTDPGRYDVTPNVTEGTATWIIDISGPQAYVVMDVPALVADTRDYTQVEEGDTVETLTNGFVYTVVAVDAAHPYVQSAGGVRYRPEAIQPGRYHGAQMNMTGSGDETAALENLGNNVAAGSIIELDGSKTYALGATLTNAVYVQPNGATLTNAAAGLQPILYFDGSQGLTTDPVIEGTLAYGTTQFTVTDASTKYQVGDIGRLWDNYQRPGDLQAVNYHMIKIADITGDTITVRGMIYTHLTGTITFARSPTTIVGCGLIGKCHFAPDDGHTGSCLEFNGVEGPRYGDITSTNTTAPVVMLRNTVDVLGGNVTCSDPRTSGSGQGYGVNVYGHTGGSVGDCHGHGMRHIFDCDSCYDLSVGMTTESNAKSAPIGIGHNGFAGHINMVGFRGTFVAGTYAVAFSGQGFPGGAADPDAAHPLREFHCGFVDAICTDEDANGSHTAVELQCCISGTVSFGPVSMKHRNRTGTVTGFTSNVVRVYGRNNGTFRVASIYADEAGTGFRCFGGPTDSLWQGTWDIGTITAENMFYYQALFSQGGSLTIGDTYSVFAGGQEAIFLDTGNTGLYMRGLNLGRISQGATNTKAPVFMTPGGLPVLEGHMPTSTLLSGTSVGFGAVGENAITADDLYVRDGRCALALTYSAGGNHDIVTFPIPFFNGQECYLHNFNAGDTITIKAGDNVHADVVIPALETVRLVAYSNKWGLA